MSITRIASRYAKTLIELASGINKLDRVKEDVESFSAISRENKDFRNFLRSPILQKDKKVQIIKSLFEKSYDDLTMKFLLLLINKNREKYLLEVAEEFILQYKNIMNITSVKLTSATELSDDTLEKISKKLKTSKFVDETVEIEVKIDPELIGGFVIEFDDKVIDTSISNKLNTFKKEFRDNLYTSLVEKT